MQKKNLSEKKVKEKPVRLHLGCGSIILPGFINIDALDLPGVDMVMDLSNLKKFKSNSVELIYGSHHLEHFPTAHIPRLLEEYFRVLKPGGVIKVAVPDLDAIAELYVKHEDWFTPPHNPWLGLLYGGQDYKFNFHKTGFNFVWLKYLLEQAGFRDVKRFTPSEEFGTRDASFASKPFNRSVSLNVQATKPSKSREGRATPPEAFEYSLLERWLTLLEKIVLKCEGWIVDKRLKLIRFRRRRMLSKR